MKSPKELLESVFKSMNEDKVESETPEQGWEFAALRSTFLKHTSEPIPFLIRGNSGDLYYEFRKNVLYPIADKYNCYIAEMDWNIRLKYNSDGALMISGSVKQDDSRDLPLNFETSRECKPAKFVKDLFTELSRLSKLHTSVRNPAFDVDEKLHAQPLKDFLTEYKSQGQQFYAYFTKLDVEHHYCWISKVTSSDSCMSKNPEVYGNYRKKAYFDADRPRSSSDPLQFETWVHPVEGYNYAPDYRLMLISRYSPEQIQDVVNEGKYPFLARAIVTYKNERKPLVFAKIYGNEIVGGSRINESDSIIEWCEEKIDDRRFYAVKCEYAVRSDYSNSTYTSDTLNYYREGKIKKHYVMPYIDPYANCATSDMKEFDREDGQRVVLMTTKNRHTLRNELGNDYSNVFSMFYGNGHVHALDIECDEIRALFFEGDKGEMAYNEYL